MALGAPPVPAVADESDVQWCECGDEAIDALAGRWYCATHYVIRADLAESRPWCEPDNALDPGLYPALYGRADLPLPALYVGGHGTQIGGVPLTLHGQRCYSAVHRPSGGPGTLLDRWTWDGAYCDVLLDSGTFSDAPAARLSFAAALERQLAWEAAAARRWERHVHQRPWQVQALVAYDVLVDEKWHGSTIATRRKERWTTPEAAWAVRETITAAAYLSSQRHRLGDRRLVLPVQGVDAGQYVDCLEGVLGVAEPADWIGLGGWCILGRYSRQWMPTYREAIRRAVPMIAQAGVRHVHLFGVLYLPALAPLLWLCDQYGLTLSTDSARPLMDVARLRSTPTADGRDSQVKAGARGDNWPDSVAWWRDAVQRLRRHPAYRDPLE